MEQKCFWDIVEHMTHCSLIGDILPKIMQCNSEILPADLNRESL